MISLVVYGRNDQHGYNSHRRVALSLNAMAEVLTGTDDEILFVDYHTPHGMPTLPEAIEDTLTDRAIALMRVLRVTPEMHMAAVGERSRLPISEPHARNTAIRRAHPGNWILSTNTDMVFVPRGEKSLTDIVGGLDGDAYCLPRFEIPEWLWESVPRNDPHRMIELLHDWGERIGLDEVTLGHDWILYDAPGDFQLVRRELMEEVHGFDEEMIHGWHVDSNLWKRIYNRTGHIGTLYPEIAGYHTNHNRTLTRYVEQEFTGNDVGRFFYDVTGYAPAQHADSWGLADFAVPEVGLARANPTPLLAAAAVRVDGQTRPLITSDAREQMYVLDYDARHVLPFILDAVIGENPTPALGYIGVSDSTAEMLAAATTALNCPDEIARDASAARSADVVVIDLGVDTSTGRGPITRTEATRLVELTTEAVEVLRARQSPARVLLVNGISGVWTKWVQANFHLSYGTFHTRVQAAEIRRDAPEWPFEIDVMRSLAFVTRDQGGTAYCNTVNDVEVLDFRTDLEFNGLGSGWDLVDEAGAYVTSGLATLRFETSRTITGPSQLTIEMAAWYSQTSKATPVAVRITLDGQAVFDGTPPFVPQIVNLRAPVTLGDRSTHELVIEAIPGDGTAYHPRHAGGGQPWIRLGGLALQHMPVVAISPDSLLSITPGSDGETLLRGIWTKTNPYGAWSLGASSILRIPAAPELSAIECELLGHPGRESGQAIRIVARGATVEVSEFTELSDVVPTMHRIELPTPDADGGIFITFEPIDAAAPTGEVVEVRGVIGR